jgi:hypothetical protein
MSSRLRQILTSSGTRTGFFARVNVFARVCLGVLGVWGGLGGSGCARTHLTPTFGRAYHEVFAIQDANPNRQGAGRSVHGLDSQEAAIIAGSYRKALAAKSDAATGGSQLLMMSPNRGGGSDSSLAPSVPPGN